MAHSYERDRLENKLCGKDLQRALWSNPPPVRMMPGVPRMLTSTDRIRMRVDMDEVFPGIIIGNGDSIKNIDKLLDLGVTHVLNTAESDVRIDPTKFTKNGICYKGFICKELPGTRITDFFEECADFIARALSMSCGLVVVNCFSGLSRSATIVAAYLMLKKNYSATQALQYMRNTREIQPNLGFLQQLAEYDNKLRKDRYRKYNSLEVEIRYSI